MTTDAPEVAVAEPVPLKEQIFKRGELVVYDLMSKVPVGTELTWWIDWPANAFYVGESRETGACWSGPLKMLADLCELGVPEDEWDRRCRVVADWLDATVQSITEHQSAEQFQKKVAAGS